MLLKMEVPFETCSGFLWILTYFNREARVEATSLVTRLVLCTRKVT